jgi:23S rRNA (cytosine1962-C5)-methyltransferase
MATEQETPTGVVTLARANEIAGTGHLWIYAGFVHAVRGQPVTGDLVDVVMPSGRFYARGLYNPASKIRVRILTFQEEPITPAFWRSGLPRRCGYGRESRPRRPPIV